MNVPVWRYRLGFLGSWTLSLIALAVIGLAGAAEWANLADAVRIARLQRIDRLLGSRLFGTVSLLHGAAAEQGGRVDQLLSDVADAAVDLDEPTDAVQTVLISTAENRLWVRRGGQTVFRAVVSTGKGTTLTIDGRKMTFDTPTGRFRIRGKEENPIWVPPDWHYVEEARKKKLDLVRAKLGDVIDAETGRPVAESRGDLWALLGDEEARPKRVLRVEKESIIEVAPDGTRKEVAPSEFIRTGKALVVPPLGFKQRRIGKTLGRYRLNLGNGYALHGTQAVSQLGRSVSHGCVRLADDDLEKLFKMSHVGDEVIIY